MVSYRVHIQPRELHLPGQEADEDRHGSSKLRSRSARRMQKRGQKGDEMERELQQFMEEHRYHHRASAPLEVGQLREHWGRLAAAQPEDPSQEPE